MKTTVTLSLKLESRQKLEDLSKASGKYMSTVVEEFIDAAPMPAGKRMLAVQGLDGVLKVDDSIQLLEKPA